MQAIDLEAAIRFHPKWYHAPYSWCGHIPFAAWLIKEIKPRIVVELGTHWANSYFAFCQAVEEGKLHTQCYAVDTWQGDPQAGFYEDDVYQTVRQYNSQNYLDFSTLLRMTFDDALSQFEDNSIELLHIDGLHTYGAVKHDFETWLPKVADGGMVLFHDTNEHCEGFGVAKLWHELKSCYNCHFEFKHSHGLGVIWINKSQAFIKSNIRTLIENKCSRFAECFEEMGNRQISYYTLLAKTDILNSTITELTNKLIVIQSSNSWKITKPLRAVRKHLKRVNMPDR